MVELFEKINVYDLIEGGILLGPGFEVSKTLGYSQCILFASSYGTRCELSSVFAVMSCFAIVVGPFVRTTSLHGDLLLIIKARP